MRTPHTNFVGLVLIHPFICRQPIPVNLQHSNLKAHLESAISSTYLHQNAGTCTSVRIGTTGMSKTKLLENLSTALPVIVRKLSSKPKPKPANDGQEEEEEDVWANVQSLMLKTSESTSLPIWSSELGGRWDGIDVEMDEVVEEEKDVPLPKGEKGKKRAAQEEASDAEEEVLKPSKKKQKKANGEVASKAAVEEKAGGKKDKTKATPTTSSTPKPEKEKDAKKHKAKKVDPPATPLKPVKSTVPKSSPPLPSKAKSSKEKKDNASAPSKPSKPSPVPTFEKRVSFGDASTKKEEKKVLGPKSKKDKVAERASRGVSGKSKSKIGLVGRKVVA